jgi:hypothetical protein
MSAPFRIRRPDVGAKVVAQGVGSADSFGFYLDRLLKLIPAEVIGLYLVGSGIIPSDQTVALVVWAVVCLVGLFAVRVYGTADAAANQPPDWTHVGISAVSFVIWIYSMGSVGPFAAWGLSVPWIGSLLVLAWTFFVPIFYKGPAD